MSIEDTGLTIDKVLLIGLPRLWDMAVKEIKSQMPCGTKLHYLFLSKDNTPGCTTQARFS